MNNELVITLGYMLATLAMLGIGLGIAYLVTQPGKRELREELEDLKRVREQNEKALCEEIEDLGKRCENLHTLVTFYKTECDYYKEQTKKNLELLQKATGGK